MRNLTISFSLAAVLLSNLRAQEQAPNQVQLGSKVAETLLVHKEEPACQENSDGTKVKGTVVIAITIDMKGNVSHVRTVSGPKMLRPIALATVRKYRYKPYLFEGKPVEVETVVSIAIDCILRTGQA